MSELRDYCCELTITSIQHVIRVNYRGRGEGRREGGRERGRGKERGGEGRTKGEKGEGGSEGRGEGGSEGGGEGLSDKWFSDTIYRKYNLRTGCNAEVSVDTLGATFKSLLGQDNAVCHLHALMCSVSDHPPSCE